MTRSSTSDPAFYYFAYGSCMCPVDLKRTLGESTYPFVIGPATLTGYRLGFYRYLARRQCGALDIVKDPGHQVEGVLYRLPQRFSALLDQREDGYRHEYVQVQCQKQDYYPVRTYTVINKLKQELPPNDWYFQVVIRGATTCGLPEPYRWQLFQHMHGLQQNLQRSPAELQFDS